MRILIVSSYLPFPLFSGGHIRLFNIIKRLTEKNHQVTLICEKRPHQTSDDIEAVKKICKQVYTVERKKQWSLENILHTGFSKDSFLISGHTSIPLQQTISQVLANESFDLIHAETSYIMQNIPKTTVPIILVEHNIEYLVYDRFLQNTPFFLKPLLAIDISKLKKAEEDFWKRATHIVTVSEKEKSIINLPNVSVVPNGVDTNIFQMKKDLLRSTKLEADILFIGDFKWVQNRDTIRWIIQDIFPQITQYFKRSKKMKLWVVGKHIPQDVKDKEKELDMICDENSQKPTEKIFADADVLLSPIRIGGGTQYKILESMAVGTPVITTPLGVEGLGAVDGNEVLVGKTPHELARLTAKVLEDEQIYGFIAKNARKFIEKNYTWEIIVEKLEQVYKTVLRI